jgi:hypothetical protein
MTTATPTRPLCPNCGKRPVVPYHPRCQSCILDRLPKKPGGRD